MRILLFDCSGNWFVYIVIDSFVCLRVCVGFGYKLAEVCDDVMETCNVCDFIFLHVFYTWIDIGAMFGILHEDFIDRRFNCAFKYAMMAIN